MLFPKTVTIVRRSVTGRDEWGNDQLSELNEIVANCIVSPPTSQEVVQGTQQVTVDCSVFFPAGTQLGPLDAVIIDGLRYEIQGMPVAARSPFTGFTAPVQANVHRVTGASV